MGRYYGNFGKNKPKYLSKKILGSNGLGTPGGYEDDVAQFAFQSRVMSEKFRVLHIKYNLLNNYQQNWVFPYLVQLMEKYVSSTWESYDNVTFMKNKYLISDFDALYNQTGSDIYLLHYDNGHEMTDNYGVNQIVPDVAFKRGNYSPNPSYLNVSIVKNSKNGDPRDLPWEREQLFISRPEIPREMKFRPATRFENFTKYEESLEQDLDKGLELIGGFLKIIVESFVGIGFDKKKPGISKVKIKIKNPILGVGSLIYKTISAYYNADFEKYIVYENGTFELLESVANRQMESLVAALNSLADVDLYRFIAEVINQSSYLTEKKLVVK